MSGRQCAIHQPNFFPWLGYFDKIIRSDVFVLLDDVQYQKTGGNWTNRVQMMISRQPKWVTAPVDRSYSGVRQIREMRFSPVELGWREKMARAIEVSYARAPCFKESYALISPLLMNPEDSLGLYNIHAVQGLCEVIGIDPGKLVPSSRFGYGTTATELLIDLVKGVGADAYLCGGGAGGYQDDEKFATAGVELIYQNFRHPEYRQSGAAAFVPGMSIIDALMETGVDGTRRLLGLAQN